MVEDKKIISFNELSKYRNLKDQVFLRQKETADFEKLLEFCAGERVKPLVKKLFFKIVRETQIDKSTLLSLTWKSVIRYKHCGEMSMAIVVVKEGKREIYLISDELYKEIEEFRSICYTGAEKKPSENDKIFPLSYRALWDTLLRFCIKQEYQEEDRFYVRAL